MKNCWWTNGHSWYAHGVARGMQGGDLSAPRHHHNRILEEGKIGHTPQYGWDFPEETPEKFRKDPGNALRAFPGIPVESTAGMPQAL